MVYGSKGCVAMICSRCTNKFTHFTGQSVGSMRPSFNGHDLFVSGLPYGLPPLVPGQGGIPVYPPDVHALVHARA